MNINRNETKEKPKTLVKGQKKPPQVRQTLTSKYRMLKANPLLMHELGKKVDMNCTNHNESFLAKPLKTLVAVMDQETDNNCSKTVSERCKFSTSVLQKKQQSLNKNFASLPKLNVHCSSKVHNDVKVKGHNVYSDKNAPRSQFLNSTSATHTKKLDNLVKQHKNTHEKHQNVQTAAYDDKTALNQNSALLPKINIHCSFNVHNDVKVKEHKIYDDKNAPKSPFLNSTSATHTNKLDNLTKQYKNTHEKHHNVQAAAYDDKTTPQRNFVNNTSEELTNKLKMWLKRRGKSFGEYHHLKCFGVEKYSENDKENFETSIPDRNSYDELKIEEDADGNDQFIEVISKVAQDALVELHRLILEGYSSEQCEIWLKRIKEKCRRVEEEPQYWECRAALEQTKGNINKAVECYKTAIVQGAEVKEVDKHLDQLLQKFSLLNINKNVEVSVNSDRSKIIQDARNIFKSSIIQFAVQERTFKKKLQEGVSIEKKLIATPVRRSTRLSRSAFTSTPGIQVYSSLQDIDNSVRNALNFQCNNALRD